MIPIIMYITRLYIHTFAAYYIGLLCYHNTIVSSITVRKEDVIGISGVGTALDEYVMMVC